MRVPHERSVVTDIRARRAERKRQEIVRAVLKVFAEKGFAGATMDDIALELEATKSRVIASIRSSRISSVSTPRCAIASGWKMSGY